MNRLRAGLSLAAVCAIVAAVLLVPLPLQRDLPLVIEPAEVRHVYTSTPGAIVAIHVRPGQRVRQGDTLLELSNFIRRDHHWRLRTARDVQRVEVALQQALGDAAQEELARASLATIEEQLREDERQLNRLVLRAPCDGVIVAPPERSAPRAADSGRALVRWSGTPLEARNTGAWLQAGVHVLSVAPDGPYRATLFVEQQDRQDVAPGQRVKLCFEQRPGETCTSRIAQISERHVESAPAALTQRFGGELSTAPTSDGRAPLIDAVYRATVLVPAEAGALLPGMRGRARITVRTRSAGEWLWRYLCTTLRFRL